MYDVQTTNIIDNIKTTNIVDNIKINHKKIGSEHGGGRNPLMSIVQY